MAGNYYVNDSDREIQVVSPTFVRPVMYVGIFTLPSQVYARFPVDIPAWRRNEGADYLSTIATEIESLIAAGLAVTAQYVQEQDENGLLADFMEFLVRYIPPDGLRGPLDSRVPIALGMLVSEVDPFISRLPGSAENILGEEYRRLQALAAQ